MKKTLIFAAAMAVAAVSCQKEKLAIEHTNSIKIAAETMPLTKVNFQDGTGPVWKAGEKASLISMTSYSYVSSELEASNIAEDGSKAWFAFESVENGTYRIVSPEPASASAEGVVFNVPASQTQDILGLSGSSAYLVGGVKSGESDLADIAVSSETTSYEAIFKLAGALLQFNVYDSSKPTGEKIKSITVTPAGAKLSGSMTVAYDGKHQSSTGEGESVTVVVNNPEIVVATKETAKAVYAAVLPAKIDANESGTVTYTIVTDGSVYSFASKAAKNWENGNIYPVNIDLAYATKVERQAPIMSSTHPKASGDLPMNETEPGSGVYKIEHVWLGGQDYTINFKAGDSGFYYNAYNGDSNAWVASEDPSFDLVYSKEPKALKIQQYGGKNYSEKYYTIILDTNRMKLKVQQHRGTSFWLVGNDCNWDLSGKTSFDTKPETKTASWSGYLKAGNYKIQGVNTSDDGWHGEWYYPDILGEWKYGTNTETGVTLNSIDPDGRHWNLPEAGYYKIEFNYSAMTIQIEKVESLDIKVNDKALTYIGNNEYSITTTFTKDENFVLSGCKKLEYVKMDPDFLKDGKFNAKTGSYTFILHLGSHDASWTSNGQTPTNSWTLFKGTKTDGVYSSLILAGEGVANLTINHCVGWTCESSIQPFMAEIDDKVYQFTGRYREQWWHLEPYDRWTNSLKFKYSGNVWYGGGIVKGVTLDDKTGKITKLDSGDLTWKNSSDKWDDGGTYRMTVYMNTNPQTVRFDKL
ncbi:MAG: hypothetical protein SPE21_06150 [Candidatus Cryptobacteroides sp.]|nr:hypothetical protein [Candidatus Cryptobacteroides sp.]